MTRTAQLTLLVSVIGVMIGGIGLIGCAQPAATGTPAPPAMGEPADVHLTRTAEMATVQAIKTLLAAKQMARPTTPIPVPTTTPTPHLPTFTATPPSATSADRQLQSDQVGLTRFGTQEHEKAKEGMS